MVKCDTCKNQIFGKHRYSDEEDELYCDKNYWYGEGTDLESAPSSLWDKCRDYKERSDEG